MGREKVQLTIGNGIRMYRIGRCLVPVARAASPSSCHSDCLCTRTFPWYHRSHSDRSCGVVRVSESALLESPMCVEQKVCKSCLCGCWFDSRSVDTTVFLLGSSGRKCYKISLGSQSADLWVDALREPYSGRSKVRCYYYPKLMHPRRRHN